LLASASFCKLLGGGLDQSLCTQSATAPAAAQQ
jgi:hypothetical protein